MVTQSFQEYKGYIIKLRASTGNGFWYKILKTTPNKSSPNGIKYFNLREQGFNFIEPEKLLFKAKNYIDNFSEKLEEKYNRLCNKQ